MKTSLLFCLLLFACLPSTGKTLTSVAEANGVSLEAITSPMPFDLTGTVLSIDGMDKSFIEFTDDSDSVPIFYDGTVLPPPRQWDVVRIKGEMIIEPSDKTRRFVAREITPFKQRAPIPPVPATALEINAGKFDFKFVRMQGVFSGCIRDEVAPDIVWAALRTDGGSCLMAINAKALGARTAAELTDSEIEVTALCIPISGLRQGLGKCLRLYAENDIRMTRPPVKQPSDAPPLSESSRTTHRQRISGTVVATSKNKFFLQTGIGRVIMVLPSIGEAMPQPGETVDIAGFVNYAPYWLTLSEAIVKITGKSSHLLEKPQHQSIADLFTDSLGRRNFRVMQTGHRLVLRGKVMNATTDEVEMSDGTNSVFVMLDAVRDQLPKMPEAGSMIEATGLCWSEFHAQTGSEIFPSFLRFTLYPHNASDIRIIASPPWWTPFRLGMLILGLVALLAVSTAWNVMLNKKAERRGRELYEERASHAIAEKKVEERTRLAVELHDSISQTLTGIAMQLEVGNNQTAKTMLTSCRSDLRRCLWDLRSRTCEEKDMTEAIERTLEPNSVGAKITVRFNVLRERLTESTTHAILHVIRELAVNAMSHGKATEIKIAGECHGDAISFSVRDNGCGFDPAAAPGPKDGHFGLLGIRERLREFGGELTIESRPGQGTKATVSLALNTHEGLRTSAPRHQSPGAEVRSQKTASLS